MTNPQRPFSPSPYFETGAINTRDTTRAQPAFFGAVGRAPLSDYRFYTPAIETRNAFLRGLEDELGRTTPSGGGFSALASSTARSNPDLPATLANQTANEGLAATSSRAFLSDVIARSGIANLLRDAYTQAGEIYATQQKIKGARKQYKQATKGSFGRSFVEGLFGSLAPQQFQPTHRAITQGVNKYQSNQ